MHTLTYAGPGDCSQGLCGREWTYSQKWFYDSGELDLDREGDLMN